VTETTIHDIDLRLTAHEAVCAERYAGIRDDLRTIKRVIWAALAALIALETRLLEVAFRMLMQHLAQEEHMLALLGSLIGLFGSGLPRILAFFERKQDHKHQLEFMREQAAIHARLVELGHAAKMAEINALADVQHDALAFGAASKPSGVTWVDAFAAMIRPSLTLMFFLLYAALKLAQFILLSAEAVGAIGFASVVVTMWGNEDWAIWSAIITFWFGNRTFNKERARA